MKAFILILNAIAVLLTIGLLSSCTILRSPNHLGLPEKIIVLTFDDGPNPRDGVTEELLAVLKKHDVKASFCVIGKMVEQQPDLLRKVAAEGHDIVNHSYSHFTPLTKTRGGVMQEIEQCDSVIGKALGDDSFKSSYYRPPYGIMTASMEKRLNRHGIEVVPVTFFIRDVTIGPEESDDYTEKMLKRFRKDKGGVVVIHEARYRNNPESEASYTSPTSGANRTWVPGAVEQLIVELRKDGYTFVSYSEFLRRRNAT